MKRGLTWCISIALLLSSFRFANAFVERIYSLQEVITKAQI